MGTKKFDDLYEQALTITNKRNKVFSELVKRTQTELIPQVAQIIDGYDLKTITIKCYTKPINDIMAERDRYGDLYWPIGITNDGRILSMMYNEDTEKYEERWELKEPKFLRSGITRFVDNLLFTIDSLNKRFQCKNEVTEELLKKI